MTTTTRHHRTGAGARINADHIGVYRLIIAGVLAAAGAAVITSWNGLIFVAAWQELAPAWRWVTPVMIDVPIVVLTLGVLAKRSRGERVALFLAMAIMLTGVSAAANFAHTASLRGLGTYEDWVGALLNALAPALVLLTTEVLGSLVTKPKRAVRRVRRAKPRARRARVAPKAVLSAVGGEAE